MVFKLLKTLLVKTIRQFKHNLTTLDNFIFPQKWKQLKITYRLLANYPPIPKFYNTEM